MNRLCYVIVGEREWAHGLSELSARDWEEDWGAHPLPQMFCRPAFHGGKAAELLAARYPSLPASAARVNLLSPHPKLRRWNPVMAKRNAYQLTHFLSSELLHSWDSVRLWLLGTRVCDAFGVRLGEFIIHQGLWFMGLPRPDSPWHDGEGRDAVLEEWIQQLIGESV